MSYNVYHRNRPSFSNIQKMFEDYYKENPVEVPLHVKRQEGRNSRRKIAREKLAAEYGEKLLEQMNALKVGLSAFERRLSRRKSKKSK